jgi:PAS domain S-box-containing protein
MGQFIAAQRDYLSFVSFVAYFICALECAVLEREEGGRRWLSFLSFFLFQALAVFWMLVSSVVSAGPWSAVLTPFLLSLSFGSLFTVGPTIKLGNRRSLGMTPPALVVIALCAGTGLAFGAARYSSAARLFLGIPGAVFAVLFLLSDPAIRNQRRPWLVAYACTFAVFGIFMLTGLAGEVLFHGGYEEAALVPRVGVSLALAGTLSMHEWRSFARLNRGYGRPLTRLVIYGSFLALPVLLVVGGFVTSWLGQQARDKLRTEYDTEADGIQNAIAAQTGEIDREVSILSGSPLSGLFLTRRDDSSRVQAVEALNRYAHAIQGTCYLLDTKGNVVASSDGAPDSFVTTSHAGASWFIDAVRGGAGRSFSVDTPTYTRVYHGSAPVWELSKGIIGVGLIVKGMVSLFPPVRPDQDAFLISENGVIFFSTVPGLEYRVLWPLPLATANTLIPSRDLGIISFIPVLDAKPGEGDLVSLAGSSFLVSRSFLSIPGWSVVLLGSIADILLYRLAGLLVTLIVMLVIAIFSAVGQMSLLDEARIERSESLYRVLIEGTPDWISIVDPKGAFIFTNRAGRESLGLDSSVSADGSIERLLGPDHVAALAGNVQFALRGGILLFETALPSAGGDTKIWHLTLVPLQAAGQEPTAILIGNDVTEMRGAEARLVRAERMAALGTLAAGVAHQFNNINAVAMGYLQVLETEPELSEKAKKYLGSVRSALERSVLITSRLLPLSVAQVGAEPSFLLEDGVRSALCLVQPDLDREGVTLELSLEPRIVASINGEQLSFVVEALLVNAWHATLGQTVRRIRVSTGSMEGETFLRVEDSGIGIAREKLSSLFTPFFTEKGEHAAPHSPQAQVRGVGLSLAVVHSMVSARGGRIEIQSEPMAGACFTVWLPRG